MDEIDYYLEEKTLRVKKEKLMAWRGFYEDMNNDWLAGKVQRQINKL